MSTNFFKINVFCFELDFKKSLSVLEKTCFIVTLTTTQLNIKNRTYYFYDDLINILNFEASNLKLDKKTSLGLNIYYTGYVDRKPEWSVNSVNPWYLMINTFYGHVEEKNGNKYLIISDISKNSEVLKKYGQVFAGNKYHIKKISEKDGEYQTDGTKIKFNTDDDIPLNKMIHFPTVTVIIGMFLRK